MIAVYVYLAIGALLMLRALWREHRWNGLSWTLLDACTGIGIIVLWLPVVVVELVKWLPTWQAEREMRQRRDGDE